MNYAESVSGTNLASDSTGIYFDDPLFMDFAYGFIATYGFYHLPKLLKLILPESQRHELGAHDTLTEEKLKKASLAEIFIGLPIGGALLSVLTYLGVNWLFPESVSSPGGWVAGGTLATLIWGLEIRSRR